MKSKILFIFYIVLQTSYAFGNQFVLNPQSLFSGPKKFYASWGYNRDWYSKSDINLRKGLGNQYIDKPDYMNLVIHNAKACDRPDFDKIFDIGKITVPQFNARLGFVSAKTGWGFEFSYDHAKYVVNDYQTLRVTGHLNGQTLDTQMLIDPGTFLHLEHTDGANFWMCNLTKTNTVSTLGKKVQLKNMAKLGAGAVIPRTDVTFLGKRTDHNFHLAGYVLGVENSIQLHVGKHFYSELSGKYAFAYFTNALLNKAQDMYITHKVHTLMAFLNVGYCL